MISPFRPAAHFQRILALTCAFSKRSAPAAPSATGNGARCQSQLLSEIEGYLLPTGALLLPGEQPHIIHADLTADHLLGRLDFGRWTSLALIDFGDAVTGGLFYELAALQPGLLNGDRAMLKAFLDAYGYRGPTGADFARRAMTCCLLHEFDVLNGLLNHADIFQVQSLEEIGERIWLV